jgi:hypothetical protein
MLVIGVDHDDAPCGRVPDPLPDRLADLLQACNRRWRPFGDGATARRARLGCGSLPEMTLGCPSIDRLAYEQHAHARTTARSADRLNEREKSD